MKTIRLRLFCLAVIASLVAGACQLPAMILTTSPTPIPGIVNTLAAQTMQAMFSPTAPVALVTATPNPTEAPAFTPTPIPTATPLATATLAPSSTPLPTSTPMPTLTPAGSETPTQTPIPCNAALFVKDVSIPDGSVIAPGTPFVKTWRLKNNGTCTWTSQYGIVFVDGSTLGSTSPVNFTTAVEPGETVDISVRFTAPTRDGDYISQWMLTDGTEDFGVGARGDRRFWVKISVGIPDKGLIYDFAANACAANWESGAGKLPCPGKSTNAAGSVIVLQDPDLETRHENEAALWTRPQQVKNGWITGTYPGIQIMKGANFIADLGCLANSPRCDVTFTLSYQIGNGAIKKIGEWREVYDEDVTHVEIDLVSLAGENVKFILDVISNGRYYQDANAFWFQPQILIP